MTVYLKKEDKPTKCLECPFINSNDECLLQGEDENFFADSWDDLYSNCPIRTIDEYLKERKLINE